MASTSGHVSWGYEKSQMGYFSYQRGDYLLAADQL
jgi:hypothetical protein